MQPLQQKQPSGEKVEFILTCTPTQWSSTGEVLEELMNLVRLPSQRGAPPAAISYAPCPFHSWMDLHQSRKQCKNTEEFQSIVPDKKGVYEVRYYVPLDTGEPVYKWARVGLSGIGKTQKLTKRIENLLMGTHSHRRLILNHVARECGFVGGEEERDAKAKQLLEIRWLPCEQEDIQRLEYLLHLRYEPELPDGNLFPGGYPWRV